MVGNVPTTVGVTSCFCGASSVLSEEADITDPVKAESKAESSDRLVSTIGVKKSDRKL
jgi:hypothetical protein